MKFTYGFTTKTVHGKEYIYFWEYSGTGRKLERYMGPVARVKTQRRMLQTKLAYLENLGRELNETIKQTRQDLEGLPANDRDEKKAKRRK